MANDDRHETSDIHEAAFLNCAGIPMTTQRRGSRCFFVFTAHAGVIAKLRHSFYDGTGQISAYSYAERLRGLKQIACGWE